MTEEEQAELQFLIGRLKTIIARRIEWRTNIVAIPYR